MPDAPTPLDLDAIRAAVADLDTAFDAPDDGRALVTEHPTLTLLAHVAAQVPALLAEVARLTTRPAPAWDEVAVVEGIARAVYPLLFEDDRQPLRVFGEARSDAELREGERDVARVRMRQALAVVREHLPVKPGREDVYRAWHGTDDPWGGCADRASIERVLDLLPGRSEAEVKAEALREAADEIDASRSALSIASRALDMGRAWSSATLRARADRLAAEGGAS